MTYVARWHDGYEVGHVDAEGVWHVETYADGSNEANRRVHDLNLADRAAGRVTGITEFVVESNDDGFHTLGWYFPDGRWQPIFDVRTREEGEPWRRWLAGDDMPEPSTKRRSRTTVARQPDRCRATGEPFRCLRGQLALHETLGQFQLPLAWMVTPQLLPLPLGRAVSTWALG